METVGKIIVALVLLPVLLVVSLVASISVVIGICRLFGADPYGGAWMFGILLTPVFFVSALFLLNHAAKRMEVRRKATRGFEIIGGEQPGPDRTIK